MCNIKNKTIKNTEIFPKNSFRKSNSSNKQHFLNKKNSCIPYFKEYDRYDIFYNYLENNNFDGYLYNNIMYNNKNICFGFAPNIKIILKSQYNYKKPLLDQNNKTKSRNDIKTNIRNDIKTKTRNSKAKPKNGSKTKQRNCNKKTKSLVETDDSINNGFGKIYKTDFIDYHKWKEYNKRPTFYAFGKKTNSIRAAGMIYYKFENNQLKLLLINCNNVYEDFGGKTDKEDESFEDTIAREAWEESNGIFEQDEILMQIRDENLAFFKESKYIVSLLETKKDYNPKDFGDIEHHTQMKRTVEWVNYSDFKNKNNIHVRLKFSNFYKKIEEINNRYNKKLRTN